jgi:hypothetical protein
VSDGEEVIGYNLEEKELAYASQCPVIVQPLNGEEDGEAFDAVVLDARRVEGSVVYTVVHGGGREVGIAGDRVKYRQVL